VLGLMMRAGAGLPKRSAEKIVEYLSNIGEKGEIGSR